MRDENADIPSRTSFTFRDPPMEIVDYPGPLVASPGYPGGHAHQVFCTSDARKRLRLNFDVARATSDHHCHATSGHFRAPPRVSYSSHPPDSSVTSLAVYVRRKVVLSVLRRGPAPRDVVLSPKPKLFKEFRLPPRALSQPQRYINRSLQSRRLGCDRVHRSHAWRTNRCPSGIHGGTRRLSALLPVWSA